MRQDLFDVDRPTCKEFLEEETLFQRRKLLGVLPGGETPEIETLLGRSFARSDELVSDLGDCGHGVVFDRTDADLSVEDND